MIVAIVQCSTVGVNVTLENQHFYLRGMNTNTTHAHIYYMHINVGTTMN